VSHRVRDGAVDHAVTRHPPFQRDTESVVCECKCGVCLSCTGERPGRIREPSAPQHALALEVRFQSWKRGGGLRRRLDQRGHRAPVPPRQKLPREIVRQGDHLRIVPRGCCRGGERFAIQRIQSRAGLQSTAALHHAAKHEGARAKSLGDRTGASGVDRARPPTRDAAEQRARIGHREIVCAFELDAEQIRQALAQIPMVFSAVKVEGEDRDHGLRTGRRPSSGSCESQRGHHHRRQQQQCGETAAQGGITASP
jgi:hypothetical protein